MFVVNSIFCLLLFGSFQLPCEGADETVEESSTAVRPQLRAVSGRSSYGSTPSYQNDQNPFGPYVQSPPNPYVQSPPYSYGQNQQYPYGYYGQSSNVQFPGYSSGGFGSPGSYGYTPYQPPNYYYQGYNQGYNQYPNYNSGYNNQYPPYSTGYSYQYGGGSYPGYNKGGQYQPYYPQYPQYPPYYPQYPQYPYAKGTGR